MVFQDASTTVKIVIDGLLGFWAFKVSGTDASGRMENRARKWPCTLSRRTKTTCGFGKRRFVDQGIVA